MHPMFNAVASSNIQGYYYVEARQLLLIAFKSGSTYQYELVPKDVVTRFANASSKGQFFGVEIRGRYVAKQLDDVAVASLLNEMAAVPRAVRRRRTPTIPLEVLMQRNPGLQMFF